TKLLALRLNRDPLSSLVIPFLSNRSGFLTNLTVTSSGPASTAVVSVLGSDGAVVGSARLTLSANARISQQLAQLVSQSRGLPKGYIRIDSSQPVVAFAEVVLADVTDSGWIPAQRAPPGAVVVPQAPVIAAGATALEFGAVNVGQTKDLDLTLRNN